MELPQMRHFMIVALRNEKGSYSIETGIPITREIVALRNEKGSYSFFKNQETQ